MSAEQTQFTPAPIPDGRIEVRGKVYMADAKGGLTPLELIKAQHMIEDGLVRKVIGYGIALSEQIARFKSHTFTDLGEFDALLAQEYGATKGGPKGNRSYMSFDGLYKVEVRTQDQMDFGSGLQQAKALIDECLEEWASDSRPEIRAIVTRAFNTDKEGQINRSEIFMLLRLDIEDARWKEAMRAIREAMRPMATKTYVRLSHRPSCDAAWQPVSIDLASA